MLNSKIANRSTNIAAVPSEHSERRFPFDPYPRGWYRIGNTKELLAGKTPRFLGQTWRVERHPSSEIVAIAQNGISYQAREEDGRVFVYFDRDVENGQPLKPAYDFVSPPEYRSDKWSQAGELRWVVRADVQDIAENAVDVSHFTTVHRFHRLPKLSEVRFTGEQMRVRMTSYRRMFGVETEVDLCFDYETLGLAFARIASGPVTMLVSYMPTPIDEETIEIVMAFRYERSKNPLRNAIIRLFLKWEGYVSFRDDIPIWENKIYHKRPVLCAGDGPIMQVRRWASQFYPAQAPSPSPQA